MVDTRGRHVLGAKESNHLKLQTVLEGRCLSIGESVGYWAFIDMLKSYFQFDVSDDERAMAGKLLAAVKELLPQQADEVLPLFGNLLSVKFGVLNEVKELDERLKFASPEQIKHQTFMATRDPFVALARRQPLILVFEGDCWLGGQPLVGSHPAVDGDAHPWADDAGLCLSPRAGPQELGSDLSRSCIIKEVSPDGSTISVWQHVFSTDSYIIHLDLKYHR